jgi:hypothetical protein
MNDSNNNKKSILWIVAAVVGVFLFSGTIYVIGVRNKWWPGGPGPVDDLTIREPSPEAQEMRDRVNFYRVQAGLQPVELDRELSEYCQRHVDYMVRNKARLGPISLAYHTENPEYPGYTQEGLNAANNSVIAFNQGPTSAVDAWMATLYHRLPLMRPNLIRIGAAAGGGNLVLDANSGRGGDETQEVLYPAAGQSNVPLKFQKEMPDPIPGGGTAGFPITAMFPESWEASSLEGTVTDGSGNPVPVYSSDPDRPAKRGFPQDGTLCLIPQKLLNPGTTYKVKVTGKAQGKQYEREWKFSTKAAAVSSN